MEYNTIQAAKLMSCQWQCVEYVLPMIRRRRLLCYVLQVLSCGAV